MNKQDFTITISTSKTPTEVFEAITNVPGWWSGLYGEEITGGSKQLNDEFTFRAGGGAHYSKQKLVELIPGKKVVWLVTDSNLTFLKKADEWTNTKICFEISEKEGKTQLTFTHSGLVPQIECYGGCAGAWTKYLDNFAAKLK